MGGAERELSELWSHAKKSAGFQARWTPPRSVRFTSTLPTTSATWPHSGAFMNGIRRFQRCPTNILTNLRHNHASCITRNIYLLYTNFLVSVCKPGQFISVTLTRLPASSAVFRQRLFRRRNTFFPKNKLLTLIRIGNLYNRLWSIVLGYGCDIFPFWSVLIRYPRVWRASLI